MAGGSSEGLDKLKEANEPLRSVANCGVNVAWGVGPTTTTQTSKGFDSGKDSAATVPGDHFRNFSGIGRSRSPRLSTKVLHIFLEKIKRVLAARNTFFRVIIAKVCVSFF